MNIVRNDKLETNDGLIDELREALMDVTASLVAAHSFIKNGGKKAAASDKMFHMMLDDYEASFERARVTIRKAEGKK